MWMWLHEMKFVQIIEQHWTNYLGGWVAQSSLQGTAVFWQYLIYDFLSGPRPRENAIAIHNVVVSLSPGENGRKHYTVFHKCALFCPVRLQYKSLLWLLHIQGIFPTFSLTFFFMASLLAKVEWGGEPLDHLESHQGTGQQGVLVLKKTGAGIWGEGPNQDRW